MKRITFFLTALFATVLVNARTPVTGTATPAATEQKADVSKYVELKEDNHDFGKIPYGKPVEYDVLMKNISKDSIKIENVRVSCGCTTPKYDQGKSYASGENFKITLGFSGYTDGAFEKSVTIFFNNGLSELVKFHGVGYKVPETSAPSNNAVQKLKSGK